MVQTASTMLPLGTAAPGFSLPDSSGAIVSLSDFDNARALLVMFICNHCPFVKHVRHQLAELGAEYQEKGVGVVAIMSNDVTLHPDDSPEKMEDEVRQIGYTFPYLYDESQDVARSYKAACTPDFFLFDSKKRLVYRGQFDDSRPKNGKPVTGKDLREATDQVLAGESESEEQIPSIGCNIKWKKGQEPDYFG